MGLGDAMPWTTVDGWPGRVWVAPNGTRTFYIRQQRNGKRHDVSTRCGTLRGAMQELARWEKDPDHYQPAGSQEGVVLTDVVIERYRIWCEVSANDPRWLEAKVRALEWWKEKLGRRDLRTLKLSELLDMLSELPKGKRDRIVVLKHLYSWLRQTDQIEAGQDPTLDRLPVPQGRPSQDMRGSKVIPEADYKTVLALLPGPVADACKVMWGTGCHLSEVQRLASSGTVEDGALYGQPAGTDVLGFRHKGGHIHRVAVDELVAEAAKRLKGAGCPSRSTFYKSIRAACRDAKVPEWTPGRFRHTFATRAVNAGASPERVAQVLGHKNGPRTTMTWYATTAVAPRLDSE